jgi:hypothetical protein
VVRLADGPMSNFWAGVPDVRPLGWHRMFGVSYGCSAAEGLGQPSFWTPRAGFLGRALDVRWGMDVQDMAGCPAVVASGSSSFSLLSSYPSLVLVLGFSMVSSGVPKHMHYKKTLP